MKTELVSEVSFVVMCVKFASVASTESSKKQQRRRTQLVLSVSIKAWKIYRQDASGNSGKIACVDWNFETFALRKTTNSALDKERFTDATFGLFSLCVVYLLCTMPLCSSVSLEVPWKRAAASWSNPTDASCFGEALIVLLKKCGGRAQMQSKCQQEKSQTLELLRQFLVCKSKHKHVSPTTTFHHSSQLVALHKIHKFTIIMAFSYYPECTSFTGLKSGQEHDSDGAPFVESIAANDLRVGKFCMINDFPCKVKELNRAAPGKHGHAKHRTVGLGIFDNKKREAIFHDMVSVPIVRKLDLPCVVKRGGFELKHEEKRLPKVLMLPASDSTVKMTLKEGDHAVVSLIIACGHYKVTAAKAAAKSTEGKSFVSEQPQVLSKKEARKQKKMLRKQAAAVATAE